MTGKDKHMPLYSSSDIEKYLSGELSDPEMHAMERAALDDPFLADALEGIVIHRNLPEQPSFRQDMDSLQKRLDDRVSRRKSRILPLVVRYAAAVILLLGVGVMTWYSLDSKKMANAPLAAGKVEVPQQQTPISQATTPAAAAADSTSLTLADGKDVALSDEKTAFKKDAGRISRQRKTATADQDPTYYKNNLYNLAKQRAAPQANNTANNLANGFLNNNTRPILSDSLFPRRDSSRNIMIRGIASGVTGQREGDLAALKKSSDQLVFRGKVLNTQNLPLAGATLSFKKGQGYYKTVTDANGSFTVRLPRYDTTSRTVAVNYVGYEQGFLNLNTDDRTGNVILLKPQQASLNEVVVSGYGDKRKELTRTNINAVPPPLSQTAVPAEGWPSYTNYLASNKNSSQIDTTIRGYESISFIVNKKGELSHFRVEQSLSPAHDSLAIRLVREGPPWKLLKGKKEKARVILTW